LPPLHERAVRVDRLVAELARATLAALVRRPADDDPSADTRAHDCEDGGVAAACGAERPFGEREGASIVDQPRRGIQRVADEPCQWTALPVARDVRQKGHGSARAVEETRHSDPHGVDWTGLASGHDQPLDDRLGAGIGARLQLALRCDESILQHNPLDVRGAQVESEMTAHLEVQPPSITRTVPVTNCRALTQSAPILSRG
jgi:hypothetical protein